MFPGPVAQMQGDADERGSVACIQLGGHRGPRLGHLVGQDKGFELQAVGLSVRTFPVQRGSVEDVGQFVDGDARQHR